MNFSIEKALHGGFNAAKEHYITIWVNGFLAILASILAAITILGIVIIPAIWGGYTESLLRIRRGEDVKIGSFFKAGFKHWGSLFILFFLFFLVLMFGFILLIVPGIYLMIALYFVLYVKLDNPELTSFEVFGRSKALVSNIGWWNVFLLYLLLTIPLAVIDTLTLNLASFAFFPFVSMIQLEAYYLSLKKIENTRELAASDRANIEGAKYIRSDQN